MKFFDLISPHQRLLQQELEIRKLRGELTALQEQNASMRAGMRRCVTCDYRLQAKRDQDIATP
jgi:hypothetical protein